MSERILIIEKGTNRIKLSLYASLSPPPEALLSSPFLLNLRSSHGIHLRQTKGVDNRFRAALDSSCLSCSPGGGRAGNLGWQYAQLLETEFGYVRLALFLVVG